MITIILGEHNFIDICHENLFIVIVFFRILLAPIIVNGEERRTEKGNRTKFNVAISRVDVREILDGLTLPILDFNRKDSSTSEISKQPEVSITMEKTFYTLKSSTGRQYIAPRFNME